MSALLDVAKGRVVQVATVYEATEVLGIGRFAEVYRAFHKPTRSDVALKLYREANEKAHEVAKAERDVLRDVQQLGTQYFPQLHQFLRHRHRNQNHPLVAMELGQYFDDSGSQPVIVSLKEVLQPQGANVQLESAVAAFWTNEVYLHFIVDLCAAVRALHGRSIIHRDLKPANILLKRPAGHSRPIPFVLDFNTSVRRDMVTACGGTEQYLPPEVHCGTRKEPAVADDLWAVARIAADVVLGVGVPIEAKTAARSAISTTVPSKLYEALAKALNVNPAERFSTAEDLYDAFDKIRGGQSPDLAGGPIGLSIMELSHARESCQRIRELIVVDLAGDDDLFVPKEVRESVGMLFTWLPEQTTRTWDLRDDLATLGPRAIPAVLELGYKIDADTADYAMIIDALADLGRKDAGLAGRATAHYGVSSNYIVRRMSRELCRRLQICPTELVDFLTEDGGLLLSDERVDIADLVIRYSRDSDALMCLTKYMCREYIIDQGGTRYLQLKETIADRIGECNFHDRALLIVQDTANHIWEELFEFRLNHNLRDRELLSHGLLQLMGDAFGSLGDEALQLLKANKVPTVCNHGQLPIWRTFVKKLAQSYEPAREWVRQISAHHSVAEDVLRAAGVVAKPDATQVSGEQVESALSLFLGPGDQSVLRWLVKQPHTPRVIDRKLQEPLASAETGRVFELLEAYLSRKRGAVVGLVLRHWDRLAKADYGRAVEVLTKYGVPAHLRDDALRCLNDDLQDPARAGRAREGLERILEQT